MITFNNKTNYYGRVISGLYKGKKILLPNNKQVRPTTDRIKETIFNILQHNYISNLQGNVLDAFAGSGSLGIEALSRGCKHLFLIEKNKECCNIINHNLQSLYNYNVINKQVFTLNKDILLIKSFNLLKFDLVFLDPPYNSTLVNDSFNYLATLNIFNPGCIFVILSDKIINLKNVKNILIKSTPKTHIQFYQ